MEGDKIPETPCLGMLLNLPVQFIQGGQVILEIGFILGPVAGVRLDEGCGDLPANILGQHRVQPDMGIAGLVGCVGVRLLRMLPGVALGPGGLVVVMLLRPCPAAGCPGQPPPPPGSRSSGSATTWRPRVPGRRRYRRTPGPGRPWPSPTGPVQRRGGWRPGGSAPGPGPGRRRFVWQKSPRGTMVAATRSLPAGGAAPAGPIRSARPRQPDRLAG